MRNFWEKIEEVFEVMKEEVCKKKRMSIKEVITKMKELGFTEEEVLECIQHKWDEGKIDLIMGDYRTGNYRIGENLYHYIRIKS